MIFGLWISPPQLPSLVQRLIQWVTNEFSGSPANQITVPAQNVERRSPRLRRSKTTDPTAQTSPLHLPDDEYIKTLKHIVILMAIMEQHVGVFEKVESCVRDAFAVLLAVVERNVRILFTAKHEC